MRVNSTRSGQQAKRKKLQLVQKQSNMLNPCSLSLSLSNQGHLLQSNAFAEAEATIGHLLIRMEQVLIERNVEKEYKSYSSKLVSETANSVLKLAGLVSDAKEPPYNYTDETVEPWPAPSDTACQRLKVKVPLLAPI